MKRHISSLVMILPVLILSAAAQTPTPNSPTSSASAQVPAVIQFSNLANDETGTPLSGPAEITFSFYNNAQGGEPLWSETQNVALDNSGHYSVYLGITKPNGVPTSLFTSGRAHWLGVQIAGQAEQPRVFLVSVPYAMKAGDAATVGGLPPSAFVMANPASSGHAPGKASNPLTETQNYVPIFTNGTGGLGNSILYESGGNEVGIGTTTPAATLEVNGTAKFDGLATFASGQIFPGTVTSVGAGTGITVTGSKSNPTININTKFADQYFAQLNAANTFTGNQTITGNLSATGAVTGSGFQIGSNLFDYGSYANGSAFLGFAGNTTTTGTINTAVGVNALLKNTTGSDNTATGEGALFFNTTGNYNTASGQGALSGNTSGGANTATGYFALLSNNGAYNTASGYTALQNNSTGTDNTATGGQALFSNTTGNQNTAAGGNAMYQNTTGSNNTATGFDALNANTASFNTATGAYALFVNTTGSNNTGSGYYALQANTTASDNTATGAYALTSNTTGASNTATGALALQLNTTGYENTATGLQALLANTTGAGNTATGTSALDHNTTGNANTATGTFALLFNTTGMENTATGQDALTSNTTGGSNTATGGGALGSNTTGGSNTADGFNALTNNQTGNLLTCIGYNCNVTNDGLINATAIGANALVTQSNSLILGGTGAYRVNVGIGLPNPFFVFTIAQGAGVAASDGWDTYSSRRWKTNIQTLHGALAKVEQLRGVSYDLKDSGKHEVGVIAEEVGAVVPEVVSWEKDGKDAQGVDYGRLTALLIEATKEQQTLIHIQQKQIRMQRAQMKAQQAQIAQLSSQVKAIKASLKTTGRGSEVRAVEAQVAMVHQ